MFSVVMSLAVLSLVAIIPMIGLTVDVGYLYASKARLQAAVDGASLAAARSLNLGANITDQSISAKQNAVNWFYSNFPPGNWATHNTVMGPNNVEVFDAPNNPQLRNVRVTATTRVPTYFMKWFNIQNTQITAVGNANRRDVVVMMVLDRSSSMEISGSCDDLRAAAKLFTGQFAAGRDRIGMVTFSDGVYQQSSWSPTQNFRTVLGYDTGSQSGSGAIDNIMCVGGTGTAEAITVGHNELYKTNLPGAYNILLIETDGLPNTLAFNLWDSTRNDPNKSAMATIDGCDDGGASPNGTTPRRPRNYNSGGVVGWGAGRNAARWNTTKVFGGFLGTFNPGPIATIYSTDPTSPTATTGSFQGLMSPWFTSANMGLGGSSGNGSVNSRYTASGTLNSITNMTTAGCTTGTGNVASNSFSEFKWLPRTDLFGNDVKPSFAYKPVTMVTDAEPPVVTTVAANQKYLKFHNDTSGSPNPTTRWLNFHNAAINAADHAAFRARQGYNGNIPVTINVIGLGDVEDFPLMQRLANDPNCDKYNQPIDSNGCGPSYPAYTMPTAFNTQLRGTFVYSANANELRKAFLSLSSQILRLSQ